MSTRILRNFIGSEYVDSESSQFLDILNPATEGLVARCPVSTEADVDRAYASAKRAQSEWANTTPAHRQKVLLDCADAIEQHALVLAELEIEETGKPRDAFLSDEIVPILDQVRFFAGAARVLEGRASGEYLDGHTSSIRREPVGVVGQVTPWNYPLMMAIWKIAPALAAGNTVVIKPSDLTPSSTLLLAELFAKFLPKGALNVVLGDRLTGRALVEHSGADMVAITGSVRAGIEVATAAANGLKRVHLELGGKAPAVVFADADLEAAVEGIAGAGFYNAGQDCTAATRVLVHESIHDVFVQALSEYISNHVITGGPDEEGVFYGPLSSGLHLEKVSSMIETLPAHAKIVTGGFASNRRGYFYEPTLVTHLHQEDAIIQQEVFGPVITVQAFSDESQALERANGVEYGLASSVWTANHGCALRMSRGLNFGCVWVNTHIPIVAEMPHGGFKHSGYGKDLSIYGLEDYTRIKHVMSYFER